MTAPPLIPSPSETDPHVDLEPKPEKRPFFRSDVSRCVLQFMKENPRFADLTPLFAGLTTFDVYDELDLAKDVPECVAPKDRLRAKACGLALRQYCESHEDEFWDDYEVNVRAADDTSSDEDEEKKTPIFASCTLL